MKKLLRKTIWMTLSMLSYICLAMLIVGPSFVRASDSNHNGIDDEIESRNSREIEVTDHISTDDELEIHSQLKNWAQYQENEDLIEFKIRNQTGKGLEIEVSYNKNISADAQFELEFGVEFEALINYTDTNLDGKFNASDDTTDASTPLGPFLLSYSTTLLNGTMSAQVTARDTTLNLNITIFIVVNYTIVNGTLVTPTELMIDISFDNLMALGAGKAYALKMKMTTTSNSGSGSEFQHETETEDMAHHHTTGEEGIKTTNSTNNLSGAFTWNKTALVDDSPKQVNMSLFDTGNENELYLSYGPGTKIYHDPKVVIEGIENTIPSPNTPSFPWEWVIVGVVIAVGALVVVFVVKRAKKPGN